ncbi:MAG: zinc-dependent alcohol dehydrogenase family protein [Solirubrobacteraceae bacterium]
MRAMQLERAGVLRLVNLPDPEPRKGEILVRVHACGVCRTDLHLLDGELEIPHPPVIPGHQIVGSVLDRGPANGVQEPLQIGERVGIPWLGWTCGRCEYCRSGQENLCDRARFTGRDIDGGFAQLAVADERYCFRLPDDHDDIQVAPLLCAGLIGYRALRLAGDAQIVGLYGFGAAAHIVAQIARFQGRAVYAFTRPGDTVTQDFARGLGVAWAGDSTELPPEQLGAAIIFASAGELIPAALRASRKGASIVCAGIHMSQIPSFPYEILWGERLVRSVANLTRADALEFLQLAPRAGVHTQTRTYALDQAEHALEDLRAGRFQGAAVIDVAGPAKPQASHRPA